VTLSFGSNLCAQGTVWIRDQPHRESARRILPKGFMCLVGSLIQMGIAKGPLTELLPIID
jgi:hypothetical protein